MSHVAVIGCGVVGAAIAYELSRVPGLNVTLLDRQPPAQAASGAALGVLMGIISRKTKGRAWAMRHASMQRYETLIPELEALLGRPIPWNRQGILLLFPEAERLQWESLVATRRQQGYALEIWEHDRVRDRLPQIHRAPAVYSPDDRQIDPTRLTLALVAAAEQNGVTIRLDANIQDFHCSTQQCRYLHMGDDRIAVDWVVVAAGLGSTALTRTLAQPIEIQPVLGQALRLSLPKPLGDPAFQPVISAEDIHLVPLGRRPSHHSSSESWEYWVGATVEFPADAGANLPAPDPDRLQDVLQGAIGVCPELASATILHTWSGLRPRPQNRSAPIVEPLSGYRNVILASGHYRNGVLLAPATAQLVRRMIVGQSTEDEPPARLVN